MIGLGANIITAIPFACLALLVANCEVLSLWGHMNMAFGKLVHQLQTHMLLRMSQMEMLPTRQHRRTSELLHGLCIEYVVDQAVVLVLTEAGPIKAHHACAVLPPVLQHQQPLEQLHVGRPLNERNQGISASIIYSHLLDS